MTEETKDTQSAKPELNRKTTLADWGNKLPIYNTISKKNIEFTFRTWDMEMEEKLSEIQQKSKNVGEFVRQMMHNLVDTYDGKDFQSLDDVTKTATLAALSFPDMMYLYIALRVEELGPELALNLNCPACKKLIEDFRADLNTLEVQVKEEAHSQTVDYELKTPLHIDGKTITHLRLGVSKWTALESVPADKAANQGTVKSSLFHSSIVGYLKDDKPIEGFVDPKKAIKSLKKFDIEKISKITTENNGGASMAVTGECPHCKAKFLKPLDWSYENFFDSSSL